jgi:hypothetical protein
LTENNNGRTVAGEFLVFSCVLLVMQNNCKGLNYLGARLASVAMTLRNCEIEIEIDNNNTALTTVVVYGRFLYMRPPRLTIRVYSVSHRSQPLH